MASSRTSRPGSRTAVVAGLLALAVALTLALGYQAVDAHRSHRSVAEKAVGEQAHFAVWEFGGASQRELFTGFLRPGLDVAGAAGGKSLDAPYGSVVTPAEVSPEKHWCWPACEVSLFRADRDRGTIEVLDADASVPTGSARDATPAEARVIAQLIEGGRALIDADWDQGVRMLDDGRLVAWRWGHDAPTLYGFFAAGSALAPHFAKVFAGTPLLPPVLTAGRSNEVLLTARALTPDGAELFAAGSGNGSPYRARHALGPAFADIEVEVALRPEMAAGLVIGGLPQSRLPWILGLMALTLGLLAVSILQIRRESELAGLRADFVSSVSHELRTPLAQIRMFAETLLLGRVRSEAEERRSMEILVGESRRLTHLVDNVLMFSRGERGAMRLCPAEVDLSALVEEVAETFEPLATAARSTLALEVGGGIVARVDGDAVRQALLNLLDNAIKYGPAGQTVRVALTSGAGGRVRLTVEDQGPGVPRGRRRIWEPYVRLDGHRESAVAGSGIGLAVVRQVAEGHGGEAYVDDADGGGARFVVELPTTAAPARQER